MRTAEFIPALIHCIGQEKEFSVLPDSVDQNLIVKVFSAPGIEEVEGNAT